MLLLFIYTVVILYAAEKKLDHNPGCLLDFWRNHNILSVVGVAKDPQYHSAKPPYFREEDARAQGREGRDQGDSRSGDVLGPSDRSLWREDPILNPELHYVLALASLVNSPAPVPSSVKWA